MVSLKEIKGRIASVGNTRKLTSAMKMVASAKLHKAQGVIENLAPYQEELQRLLGHLLQQTEGVVHSPLVRRRPVRRVAVVAFASNGSLCGGFNANVQRRLAAMVEEYRPLGVENLQVYVVGKKVADEVRKWGIRSVDSVPQPVGLEAADKCASTGEKGGVLWLETLAEKPTYEGATALVQTLVDAFLRGEIDRVELLYPHFQSTASQPLVRETYLPMSPEAILSGTTSSERGAAAVSSETVRRETSSGTSSPQPMLPVADYLVEPSAPELLQELLPKVLRLKLYTVLLDSRTAEHAARTLAMQTATDNADAMLQDLTLQYHKSRQQAITNELLDIMGGSMA